MIERKTAYAVGDKTFGSLEEAQKHEIVAIIGTIPFEAANARDEVAALLVKKAEQVIDILKTTARSHVKARKINGGVRKTRSAKNQAANLGTAPKTGELV